MWSLNVCSCTTWFLDLDDLVRISRAWLHKEPKVLVLQPNAKLVQKRECWNWNHRSRDSILTGSNIVLLEFFYVVLALLAMLCICKKKLVCQSLDNILDFEQLLTERCRDYDTFISCIFRRRWVWAGFRRRQPVGRSCWSIGTSLLQNRYQW